jgi:hypothetical protein
VKMCLQRIQSLEMGETVITLLHTISYLDPDGVPLSFLEKLMVTVDGSIEFLPSRLRTLRSYSLISVENGAITMHRIVQRIVPLLQFTEAQSCLQTLLYGIFKSLITSDNGIYLHSERRQAAVVWNHLNKDGNLIGTSSKPAAIKTFLWSGFGSETHFVGRNNELAELQDYHSNERIKIVVISGLAGTGKSKLAFQYAKTKQQSTNCVWLRGETTATFLNSVNNLTLAMKLKGKNIDGTQRQFEEMLTSIRSEINRTSDQPWLFILDNVDSMHEFVTPVVNSLLKEPNVFIILTSILRNVASKRRTAILMELTGFNDEDASKFINERLGNSKEGLARELSKALQGLPLAIDQAVQYILDRSYESLKGSAYGIQDFLSEYHHRTGAMEILDYELEDNEMTVFTTVKMCLHRIQAFENGEDTVSLLHVLCYLDPDEVPLSFLKRLISIIEGSTEFLESRLTVLLNYSLILVKYETITLHRVVQRIVPLLQVATAQRLLERVVFGTFKCLSISNFMFLHSDLRQAAFVWNHIKTNDDLMLRFTKVQLEGVEMWLKQRNVEQLVSFGFEKQLFASIADVCECKAGGSTINRMLASISMSRLKALIDLEFFLKEFPILKEKYGENHPIVLRRRSIIIRYQFRLKTTDSYLEEMNTLIAKVEEQLGKDHPDLLDFKSNLGACLYEDGIYSSALELARNILTSFVKTDWELFKIRALEVNCYDALGEHGRASELHWELEKKMNALRKEEPTLQIDSRNKEKEETDPTDWCDVSKLFLEVSKLLDGRVVDVDDKNHKIELESTGTCEVDVDQKIMVQDGGYDAFLDMKNKFRVFFTHAGNFSKAVEILDEIKKYCSDRVIT